MNEEASAPEASTFREDDLFNSRTTVFLATNGIFLAGVGLAGAPIAQLLISLLGTIITLIWLMVSWQNLNVIRALYIEYRRNYKSDHIENIVQNAMFRHGWKRPTKLIAKPLPWAFLVTWLALAVITTADFK